MRKIFINENFFFYKINFKFYIFIHKSISFDFFIDAYLSHSNLFKNTRIIHNIAAQYHSSIWKVGVFIALVCFFPYRIHRYCVYCLSTQCVRCKCCNLAKQIVFLREYLSTSGADLCLLPDERATYENKEQPLKRTTYCSKTTHWLKISQKNHKIYEYAYKIRNITYFFKILTLVFIIMCSL